MFAAFLSRQCLFYSAFLFVSLCSKPSSAQPISAPSAAVAAAAAVVPPTVVGRGDKIKRCPPNFQDLGKECVRVVQAPAQPQCSPNTALTPEGTCAIYSGKIASCQPGYTLNGSNCERTESASPSQYCAAGFTLTSANECVAPIVVPPRDQCPGGSVRRGDLCIMEQEELPELTCPPGYTLDGKACRIEELYNCTPARPAAPVSTTPQPQLPPPLPAPSPPVLLSASASVSPTPPRFNGKPGFAVPPGQFNAPSESYRAPESYRARAALGMNYVSRGFQSTPPQQQPQQQQQQQQPPPWRRGQAYPAQFVIPPLPQQSKEFVPENTDYVVQATCKRIRTIAAQKLCPRGLLNGKTCRVEVEVPAVSVSPQAMEYDVRPPSLQCPPGFTPNSPTLCLLADLKAIVYVCPEGTQDIGDRCASFTPPAMICPPGFVSETDTVCVQTQRAPPLTEFTIRYACVGKDCDHQ